jgi:hypothetical protein
MCRYGGGFACYDDERDYGAPGASGENMGAGRRKMGAHVAVEERLNIVRIRNQR